MCIFFLLAFIASFSTDPLNLLGSVFGGQVNIPIPNIQSPMSKYEESITYLLRHVFPSRSSGKILDDFPSDRFFQAFTNPGPSIKINGPIDLEIKETHIAVEK